MDNRKENKNYEVLNDKILDTDFSDNYSVDNFSYSSENFIYSPLKCHYPSSYIPSDGYKSSKCIRIKKRSSHDKNRRRKSSSSNNEQDNIRKNQSQDSSSELSIKKHMEYLQNDRNKKMETLLKKSESNSQKSKNNLEHIHNDDSFFSIDSLPSISSFSFGSSDQTKSTIKRIYKNYMDSISIDSPSKLSNETFLKYIETPIFEKTKVMFSKEEKKDNNVEDINNDNNNNNNNNNNKYKLYYNSTEDDYKSYNSYLSNSPIIQYQKHITSRASYSNDDNVLITPKSKNSSIFPNNISHSSSLSNLSPHNKISMTEKLAKDIPSPNNPEKKSKKSLLEMYSSPNHDTIPSFIDNVTSKFDSEINYIKENPLIVSSASYSSKNPTKYTSNENTVISTVNDTLDDVSITNENIEIESLSNPNLLIIDNQKLNNKNNSFSTSSRVLQKKDEGYKTNLHKSNVSYNSNTNSDSLKIRYSITDDIHDSIGNVYTTSKYNDKTLIKKKISPKEYDLKKEDDALGSYEIISPTESFEKFLMDSKKLVKNRDTGIGRKNYRGKYRYTASSSNKNFNDSLSNIGEFSDDSFDNDNDNNKDNILSQSIIKYNNYSLNTNSSSYSLNSDKKENNDIFISIRKNNSYDNNKYSTNTKEQEHSNDVHTNKNSILEKVGDDSNIKYKSNISQIYQDSDDKKGNDDFNGLLRKFKKENRPAKLKSDENLKSSNFNNKINDNKSINNFSTLINDNEEDDILSDANQKEFKKFNEIMNNLSNVRHSDLYLVQNYTTSTNKKLSDSGKLSSPSSSIYKKNKSYTPPFSPLLDEEKSNIMNSFSEMESNELLNHRSYSTYPNNINDSNGKTIVFEDNDDDHHSLSFDSSDMIIENDDNDEIELPFDKITLDDSKAEEIHKKEKKDDTNDDSIIYNLRKSKILDDLSFNHDDTIDSLKLSMINREQSTPISKSSLLSPINPSIKFSLNNNDSFFNYSIIEPSILKNKDDERNIKDEQSDFSSKFSENQYSSSNRYQTSSRRSKLPEIDRRHHRKEMTKSSSILSSPTLLNYYHQELEKENEEKSEKKNGKSDNLDLYEKLMNDSDKNNMKLVFDIIARMNTIQTDLNRKFEMQSKLLENLISTKEEDGVNHDNYSNPSIPPLFTNDDSTSYHPYDSSRHHGPTYSSNNYSTLTNSTNSLSSSHYQHQFKTLKSYQKDIEKLNKYQNSNMEYLLEIINDIKGK